ncbi:hypothetical protein FHS18_004438 [Paenibacillus phyllosphaerae]|uniref:Uncharacterized protein n=1 Tax=Paenibacillus phyllosphaerae TaxID=274593 RepID=A0A7W5B165_9BACL|nr:hypothetical protein [Paenibacillus phyllosphaerae]MBB3112352.1 hypothetical protein [Paenibacillus phyllosphaerae]
MIKRLWPLFLIVVACTVSYTWNRAEYLEHQLESPLFIPQYTELNGTGAQLLDFYFLENNQGGKRISWATLEVPEYGPVRIQDLPRTYSDFTYQQLKHMMIYLEDDQVRALRESGRTITELKTYYEDGTAASLAIGRISLVPDKVVSSLPQEESPLTSLSSMSTSDGQGVIRSTADEAFTITELCAGMKSPAVEALKLKLSISSSSEGRTVERELSFADFQGPVEVPKGAVITLKYAFEFPELASVEARFYYRLAPQLIGKTISGHAFQTGFVIDSPVNPGEEDLRLLSGKAGDGQ